MQSRGWVLSVHSPPSGPQGQPQEGTRLTLQELVIKLALAGSKVFSNPVGEPSFREMVLLPGAEKSDCLAWPLQSCSDWPH